MALLKLFSDAVTSPRLPDGELWSTGPDSSPVLGLGHGREMALSGAYISSVLQDILVNGKRDCTVYTLCMIFQTVVPAVLNIAG